MNPSINGTPPSRTRLFRILQTLELSPSVSYILDAERRFVYCNPVWDQFAKENDAPQLVGEKVIGFNLFDAIPYGLRSFFSAAFMRVSNEQCIWEKSYECSSPDVFRKYRMRIHLLKHHNWFLVTNPLIVERSHGKVAKPDSDRYVDGDGLIMMCIHCRCSRRVDNPDQWDFVPQYLRLRGEASMQISHGFCPTCQLYFYPDLILPEEN